MTASVVGSENGTEQITVHFSGMRARMGPMSVGQQNMRLVVQGNDDVAGNDPEHINACLIWDVPSGASLHRVADLVRTLVERHETLRTTFPAGPRPVQSVAGEGMLSIAVHAAGGEPGACAEAVGRRMRAVSFDPSAELPLRAAVVTVDGAPARLVVVLCHVAVDAVALDLLAREWADLAAGRRLQAPSAVQPVDVAEMEHTKAGQRRLEASRQYWEQLLLRAPQAMFAVPGAGVTDWMLPRLRIRSLAAASALERLAERTGVSRATAVLAAMCALLNARLGQQSFVVSMLAANRFLPQMGDYMGTIAQDAAMSVELDTQSFDEVLTRVRDRSLTAYRRSWFDAAGLWDLMAEVGRQRGTHWARDCVFNDLTELQLSGLINMTGAADTSTADTDAADGTAQDGPADDVELTWLAPESMMTRFMLWLIRLDGAVELSLWADPQCLSAAEAECFSHDIVRLLVQAAAADVNLAGLAARTGLEPVRRGEGWYRIDSCWIELAAVQQLVRDVFPGRCSLVVPRQDVRLGHRLDCYVAAGAGPRDPQSLHAACLSALSLRHWPTAMAPHRYVICDGVPDDPASVEEWQHRRLIAEGSGR